MIAKTGNLAQLYGWSWSIPRFGLLVLLPACSEVALPESEPPAAAVVVPESWATPDPVPSGDWTYAASLAEFHGVWTERVAFSARPDTDPKTLLPHVDAIEVDGASWGARPDEMAFTFMDAAGHAHRVAGPVHPSGDRRGWTASMELPPLTPSSPLHREEWAGGFRLTGGVFNRGMCAECHEGPAERLLGALVYEFREIPDD